MTTIDEAQPVRAGEELEFERLENYLARHLPKFRPPLTIAQFPGGFSNLTYLLQAGDLELVLRRPPFGAQIAGGHDMGREYRVLSALHPVYDRVPRPLHFCEDESIIGAPFYLMQRVRGLIVRSRTAAGVKLTPEFMGKLSAVAVDNLAAIHALDFRAAGLGDLGRPEGYVERQVGGWVRRYKQARTDPIPSLEEVGDWLQRMRPADGEAALIHNDYKFDNLILDPADPGRIMAVLDWEMCTIGDPLMDLGTSLGYWVEPTDPEALAGMFGLTTLPGNFDRRQVVEHYEAASGRVIADPLFYYVFGLYKIAGIIQQIYARYRRGHTQDPRFASLIHVVRACGETGALALHRDRISGLTS